MNVNYRKIDAVVVELLEREGKELLEGLLPHHRLVIQDALRGFAEAKYGALTNPGDADWEREANICLNTLLSEMASVQAEIISQGAWRRVVTLIHETTNIAIRMLNEPKGS